MNLTDAILGSRSISDLRSIILARDGSIRVKNKLSFWGKRYIEVVGYEGISDVDLIASKVIELVKEKNFEFTQEERIVGKAVAKKINRLYKIGDNQLKNSNCFTRLLCAIREAITQSLTPNRDTNFSNHSLTRWEWNANDCGYFYSRAFSYYTIRQFKERFGNPPWNIRNTPFSREILGGSYDPPQLVYQWEAEEERVPAGVFG